MRLEVTIFFRRVLSAIFHEYRTDRQRWFQLHFAAYDGFIMACTLIEDEKIVG
jgi:hypothetical protein